MATDSDRVEQAGLSRRQVLARGAVAAGVVWAAPVIRSAAAYATTGAGTERPCTNFYAVWMNEVECRAPHWPPGFPDAWSGGKPDVIPPAIVQWVHDNPDVPLHFPSVCPQITQMSDSAWAVLLPAVTGPNAAGRQCRLVIGWALKWDPYPRKHFFSEGYVDPNPPIASEDGRRIIFPCPHTQGGGDHGGGDDDHGDTEPDGDDDDHGGGGEQDRSAGFSTTSTPSADTSSKKSDQGGSNGNGNGEGNGGGDHGDTEPDGDDDDHGGGDHGDTEPDGDDDDHGGGRNHRCIDHILLIYCCP